MKISLFLLLFCLSCSSDQKSERENLISSWQGRSLTELEQHPFFSQLHLKERTLKGNREKRIYEEPGQYRSKASCLALGGCMGLSSGSCQNIFIIEKGEIKEYEMKESCPSNKSKAPLHHH